MKLSVHMTEAQVSRKMIPEVAILVPSTKNKRTLSKGKPKPQESSPNRWIMRRAYSSREANQSLTPKIRKSSQNSKDHKKI